MLPIAVRSQSLPCYIFKIHLLIFEVTKEYLLSFSKSTDSEETLKNRLMQKFYNEIDELSKRMINEVFGHEFEHISRIFFSKIIKRCKYSDSKFNFFIELEKVLCDYYNLIQYISRGINGCDIIYIDICLFGTSTPKIIKALKFTLPSNFKVRKILYYNIEQEEFELESNDYILRNNMVYIFFEKITELEIEYLKFISLGYAVIKKDFITTHTFPNKDNVMYSTYYETTSANCSIS